MADSAGPRTAGLVMIVGGIALAALTFITWYEIGGVDASAWDALRRTDVVVFAAGLAAAAAGAWLAFGDIGPEAKVVALLGAGAAGLAGLIVIVRMVSPPGDGDLKIGIFLALLAAVIAAIGGLMALSSTWRSPPARPTTPG
ncbi:MAG: hypothetical protein ACRDL1_09780 [Solirubrobacterales bacterium]